MYNLHKFNLVPKNKHPASFPDYVDIVLELSPSEAFGVGDGYCRTTVRGEPSTTRYDATSGRQLYRSNPPMQKLAHHFDAHGWAVRVEGNIIKLSFLCTDGETLAAYITHARFDLPMLMNLAFGDAIYVKDITVSVGKTRFSLDRESSLNVMTSTTHDELEKQIEQACRNINLFYNEKKEPRNLRLAFALRYFHIATRLRDAGSSDWEFMAECILNLDKVLDILFQTSDQSHDEIRQGLSALGYPNDEIETDFISIAMLRNQFDVAHPAALLFQPDELEVVYNFLTQSVDRFRALLVVIIEKVKAKQFELRDLDRSWIEDSDRKRTWSKMLENIKKRKPISDTTHVYYYGEEKQKPN